MPNIILLPTTEINIAMTSRNGFLPVMTTEISTTKNDKPQIITWLSPQQQKLSESNNDFPKSITKGGYKKASNFQPFFFWILINEWHTPPDRKQNNLNRVQRKKKKIPINNQQKLEQRQKKRQKTHIKKSQSTMGGKARRWGWPLRHGSYWKE